MIRVMHYIYELDEGLYNIITYLHAYIGFLPLPSLNCNLLSFLFSFASQLPFFIFSNSNYEHFHRRPELHDTKKQLDGLFVEFGQSNP